MEGPPTETVERRLTAHRVRTAEQDAYRHRELRRDSTLKKSDKLAMNPLEVLKAMGAKQPGASRPTSTQSQRPNTGKSTGSAMELVDRLVDVLPVAAQKGVIRCLATLDPAHRRVFVQTLLDHVPDEAIRLKAFSIIERLLDASPGDPGSAAGPLVATFADDPTEAVEIINLWETFPEHRWRELPVLDGPRRSALLGYFRQMTRAEKKKVGRACGGLLPMHSVLELLDAPPDHRCSMCRVKRAHKAQYLLEQNAEGSEEAPADRLLQPFTADLYTFELRDEDAKTRNPVPPSILKRLGLEDSIACVCFDHGRVRVDTATICGACRAELYGFMAHLGNDREYQHLLGARKLKQLQLKQEQENARAAWWRAERKRSVLYEAVQTLHGVRGKVRARAHRAKKAAEAAAEATKRRDAVEAARRARAELNAETTLRLEKWVDNDARNTGEMLVKRTLYCRLQSEKEHRLDKPALATRWDRREVENGGISSKKRELSDDGIPLTEAAAAAVFGTAPLVVPDESAALAAYKGRAADYEGRSVAENANFRSHSDTLSREQWTMDCDAWRHDSLIVDDIREKRRNHEALLREDRIRVREDEKARLRLLREEHRLDGAARAADARRALRATREAKRMELKRERAERTAMTLQEADQCTVDRFWGVFLNYERDRRLEEMRRLVWLYRIDASHEVMKKTKSVSPGLPPSPRPDHAAPPIP